MPNNRHQKQHRQRDEDAHNNNQQPVAAAIPREAVAGAGHDMGHQQRQNDNAGARLQQCSTPGSCCYPSETIDPEDPYDAVKVACNNEHCTEGCWMHKDCFEEFEQSVLAYLRSCGRARSWSEKQRLQNLWTKKGYDLAFKACDCKCGRGHLRKNLDYIPPPINDNAKKHRKHKKKNDKPMPVVSTTHKSNSHNSHVGPLAVSHTNANTHHVMAPVTTNHAVHVTGSKPCKKKNATSTSTKTEGQNTDNHAITNKDSTLDNQTTTTTAPTTNSNGQDIPSAVCNNNSHGPLATSMSSQLRLRTNSMSSVGSVGSHTSSISSIPSSAGSASPISSSPINGDMFFKSRKSSDASSDTGLSTILSFRQRQDLSAFTNLPRYKQNPYHIRMEDASTLAYAFMTCSVTSAKPSAQWDVAESGGCDVETRNFVLTNLLSKRMTSTRCSLCKMHLAVFDRLPLIDGTFFLSPQSYDESAIQVIWDGRLQFLNATCLGCLEGQTDVKCVACKRHWDGRNLVVGSMYTYDIFAATPCCQKRLTCKCCRRAVVDISVGLNFYSQYSHMIICPYCKANDYHFIRSLGETFLVADGRSGFGAVAPICH